VHHQGAGQADALAHAAGHFFRIGVLVSVKADQIDGFLGAFFTLGAVHALGFQAELHVFLHGQPGK